jgi:hypothetical protein
MHMTRIFCLAILALIVFPAFAQSPFIYFCKEDSDIAADKRAMIESTANNFLQLLLGPNPERAFELMSEKGRANVTQEQLKGGLSAILQLVKPQSISLQHTYFIELKGNSPGRVVCGRDISKSDGWESLEAADVPEQAHVVIMAKTVNNLVAFTVWLVPEQNSWKVQSFWMNAVTLADKDSLKLWQLAQEQRKKGHNFNAALFYAAAAQTANRGPNFQMGIAQSISQDSSTLTMPPDILGPPPFLWKNGENTYKVMSVGPIAVGGKIYLILVHEVSPWQSNEQVDHWNKEFLRYVKQRFPEYTDAFAGLVARARERGSARGFGTVEESPDSK